ncbi:hypothetical protein [Kriegella aquimaris]|uniref:Uncharacterized protein n=1 Tax=Kriegella aquimaris TaxID=192904 RepID=A0A1G9JG48_9FLAO|nr:hypothetical protein [Kriegella aquimaris]SDL36103.1 hypothetical protein SAMN04488514_101528 [Kriegella aquimaris]
MIKRKSFSYPVIAILTVFALLTLFLSSSVLFDWFGIRAKEGNYVPFVVWANFVCSWLYLLAVYGFIKLRRWTYKLLTASALILVLALIVLYFHINGGGLYETKTVGALFFRITLSLVFALLAYLRITKE